MFSGKQLILLSLASIMVVPVAFGQMKQQVNPGKEARGAMSAATIVSGAPGRRDSPYHPERIPTRAKGYYVSAWGVDNFLVRQTASGSLIRFSYRVTDPARAKPLGDKEVTPFMIGQRSHMVLQIPVMENIGQLRQAGVPQAGKEYWMVFSNKGNPVKPGDRVNVVIGSFHADGLLVE